MIGVKMTNETIDERAERLENEIKTIIDPEDKNPNVVVKIDDKVLNEEPYDDRFFINNANKITNNKIKTFRRHNEQLWYL